MNINLSCGGGYVTVTIEYDEIIASSSISSFEAREMTLFDLIEDLNNRINTCLTTIYESIEKDDI